MEKICKNCNHFSNRAEYCNKHKKMVTRNDTCNDHDPIILPSAINPIESHDTTGVICNQCGWKGLVMDLCKGYQDDGDGDVEATSECPECGSDDWELIKEE